MWDTAEHKWPGIVKLCVDTWRELNPDYAIHVFDAEVARRLLVGDFSEDVYDSLLVQHQADLLRTKLLAERGGIWVDATCIPHRPIDKWIGRFADSDFAGLKTLQKGQTVDNWFMVAREKSTLMSRLYEALRAYWKTPKMLLPMDPRSTAMVADDWEAYMSDHAAHRLRIAPYFLWHYLFTLLVRNDEVFARVFRDQVYSSQDAGCGRISHELRDAPPTTTRLPDHLRQHIIEGDAPLSKLVRSNPVIVRLAPEIRDCVYERRRRDSAAWSLAEGVRRARSAFAVRRPGEDGLLTQLRKALLEGADGAGPRQHAADEKRAPAGRGTVGIDVSPDPTGQVIDAAADEVRDWQGRPLDAVYPVIFFDTLRVRIGEQGVVTKKPVHVALALDREGHRHVLGLWVQPSESAQFWREVANELKSRGVDNILFAVAGELEGFHDAMTAAFPRTIVQTCIVRLIRHSLSLVARQDRRQLLAALRAVHQAETAEIAELRLGGFEAAWGSKYPAIGPAWRQSWKEVVPFFSYPAEIRATIDGTDAIDGLLRGLRKVVRSRGEIPSDEAAIGLLYLAVKTLDAAARQPSRGAHPAEDEPVRA
jgi:hypothetical protein